MPSIFLLKQWLCTQLIQGLENATKRDLNIKRRTIGATLRAPNNDRSFIAPLMRVVFHLYREIFPRDDIFKQLFVCAAAFISSVLKPQRKGSIKISHTQRQGCRA